MYDTSSSDRAKERADLALAILGRTRSDFRSLPSSDDVLCVDADNSAFTKVRADLVLSMPVRELRPVDGLQSSSDDRALCAEDEDNS